MGNSSSSSAETGAEREAWQKYEEELQEWKEICAAMAAEEAAMAEAVQPDCFAGSLYVVQECCGLAVEIPLRCSWHLGCASVTCLLCGPIGCCAEHCERACTDDPTPPGLKPLRPPGDNHSNSGDDGRSRGSGSGSGGGGSSGGGGGGGEGAAPNENRHSQRSDEVQPRRPRGSHSALYQEAAARNVNPCCIAVDACVERHCRGLELYSSLACVLCDNLIDPCLTAICGDDGSDDAPPLYVYAQEVALRRPPMPLPPPQRSKSGDDDMDCDACLQACCSCNCKLNCGICCEEDCCAVCCHDDCCDKSVARTLYRRELVSMLAVFGPGSCHPAVCIAPPPPISPRVDLSQSGSCWESEEARMLRWADEYSAAMDARTAAFYERRATTPNRYVYTRSDSLRVTAKIDKSVPVPALVMEREERLLSAGQQEKAMEKAEAHAGAVVAEAEPPVPAI